MKINLTHSPFDKESDRLFPSILFVILGSLSIDALVEYNIQKYSAFFFKDLINLMLIGVFYIMYKLGYTARRHVLTLSIYSIIISVLVSLPFRLEQDGFQFEPYFLKVEMILIILTFAIGVLIHRIHKIIMLSINLLFIAICSVILHGVYPIEKFLFYTIMISGTGYAGFYVHKRFVRLTESVQEANTLIRNQNEELKRINHAKSQLLSIISHDLKTPFAQMTSLIEIWESTENVEEQQEIKELMKESAVNGQELLTRLLKWSLEYDSSTEASTINTPLRLIIQNAIQFNMQHARSKNIQLMNHAHPQLSSYFDQNFLETVIRNLISNAIKYSQKDQHVSVYAMVSDQHLQLSVVDEGIGITSDVIDQILMGKVNASQPGTSNEKGTGSGLLICKELIETQKGSMEIESIPERGTTIHVFLPID